MTDVALDPEATDRFFAFARERQAVYLRRRAGLPAPWTRDDVLRVYRITNVYREQDKTTAWFRKYVRDPLRDRPEVLLATVLFRWFNTIRTGETVFLQPHLPGFFDRADRARGAAEAAGVAGDVETPWEAYLRTGDPDAIRGPLRRQGSPWVTGAYMIRSPEGMDKLDGILKSVDDFRRGRRPWDRADEYEPEVGWERVAAKCHMRSSRSSINPVALESVWKWLKQFYGLGPFLAYEIVTDLRHTALLDRAPDVLTWANPGPGALRGAALLLRGATRGRKGRLVKSTYPEAHAVMARLLELSRDSRHWPQFSEPISETHERKFYQIESHGSYFRSADAGLPWRFGDLSDVLLQSDPEDWPAWEMREPEMWCCEFAKYERTRLGFGRPRGKFQK